MTLPALVAQFGFGAAALGVIRIIATLVGALLGWFLSDALARVIHRLVAQKPIAPWSLPWIKLGSAVVAGLLVYLFLPLGGGPGGLGYGPGAGGDPGMGPGPGGTGKDVVAVPNGKKADDKPARPDDKARSVDKAAGTTVRKMIEIEVLGGKRYPGDNRYYLLRPGDQALTLPAVEDYFKVHGGKLELHVVLTDDSPAYGNGPIEDLTALADRYQIPTLREPPEVAPKRP